MGFYGVRRVIVKKKPPLCRVLQSFEPAFAGGFWRRSFALAEAYRVTSVMAEPFLKSVGSKPRVQHHKHSRVSPLYHNSHQLGR